MTSHHYPSSLSDRQWTFLSRFLPKASRRGRKRIYSRRLVVDAILYVLRSGCQWRMLPKDFPPWKTVYQIFYRWRLNGIWERLHDAMRDRTRKQMGRNRLPRVGIIDSQSVKTTEAGGIKGFDAGKKVNGRKRHLIVDTQGFLLAVAVHSADQQDQDGACLVLSALWEKLKRVRVIFADSAYARRGLPAFVQSTLGYSIEVVRKSPGVRGFAVVPKRWIVERTFAWLGRSRRHSKDYERNPETSETFIRIAMTQLMLKRLVSSQT